MNNVPVMPDDVEMDELVELVVQLAGVRTLWALACLFASAEDDEEVVISGRIVKQGDRAAISYDPMAAVTEWHDATGQKLAAELDAEGQSALALLRHKLIYEEQEEVGDELQPIWRNEDTFSKARLAAELADLIYVVYGTAQLFEINLPAVFEAVHAKNMEKVDPETGKVIRREDGKILKPEGFKPLTDEEIAAVMN